MNTIKISELINPDYVFTHFEAKTKSDLMDKMIDMASSHPNVLDKEAFSRAIWSREKEMSTGIGKAIGLPHAKTSSVKKIVIAFYSLKEPVEFESIDGVPVEVLFLIATHDSMLSEHLKILSKISRIVGKDSVRYRLRSAKTSEEVINVIREEEDK